MTVEGHWKLKTQTPLGERKSKLRLVTAGAALTGEQSAEGQSGPIFDGSVDGNAVGWKVRIVEPVRMTLEYRGTVWGDLMSGHMKAGRYGKWPFAGRRR
jgi:hypothetical protein